MLTNYNISNHNTVSLYNVLIFLTDYVYFPKHTSPIHQQRLNIYHWHPLAEYNASEMNYLWAKYWSIIPPLQGLQILQFFLLNAIIYDFWDLYKTDKTDMKFVSYHISCIMYISEIWYSLSKYINKLYKETILNCDFSIVFEYTFIIPFNVWNMNMVSFAHQSYINKGQTFWCGLEIISIISSMEI